MTDASETPDPVEVADETSVAFVGVNVVPMDAERILRDQTVMVRGGRIVELGPLASVDVPEDAIQISGRGRYLMPGLADMHVHLWWHGWSPLYVANGVTTLRVMQGDESTLNMQRGAVEHDMPTIHSAGPLIEGEHPPHDWPEGWHPLSSPALVRTAEEGREAVRRTQEAGFQFVKVHNFLRSEAYAAIVAAAEEAGLPVVGHVPEGGIGAVLEARQSSVEHLFGYLLAAQAPGSPAHRSATYFSQLRWLGRYFDQGRMRELADATVEAGTWNCPTLAIQLALGRPRQENLARPEARYVPRGLIDRWDTSEHGSLSAESDEALAIFAAEGRQSALAMLRILHDAGARLLLGTDAPAYPAVWGFSLHEELAVFVEAGLSPYEALRAGTHDAAEYLDALDEFGVVAVGRRADLILLRSNPLEDVANAADRVGVMLRGRWFSEAALQTRLGRLLEEQHFEYRDCHDADIENVLALWRDSGAVPRPTDDVEGLRERLARDRNLLLLATRAERVVGTLEGSWDGWRANMQSLVVHPEYQGRGIRRELVARVEQAMRERGIRRITASVLGDDPIAAGVWWELGYRRDDAVARYSKDL